MLWIDNFVRNEILVCNSNNKELQTKSCCEFLLFCYNLKLLRSLDKNSIDLLKEINQNTNIIFYKPLYQICIEKDENIELDKIECVENMFIKSVVEGYKNYAYWTSLLNKHLINITRNGLDKEAIYNLTHIIFYSTNFGSNDFFILIKTETKKIINSVLKICIKFCEERYNWDLIRELYLCLLYLDPLSTTYLNHKVKTENELIKSNLGWYLSDGLNRSYFEKHYDQLSFKQKYSLFHTTLICELLEKTIARKNYAQHGFCVRRADV